VLEKKLPLLPSSHVIGGVVHGGMQLAWIGYYL
jgi:hypothetical protein